MDKKAACERVPSTLSEIKNHPLWVLERFLPANQVVYPRDQVKGFIQGEFVFPRSRVQTLRSADRWKAERRRTVKPDELTKPVTKIHSRRARAAIAARDAARRRAAAAATAAASGVNAGKRAAARRKGPKSVEEKAAETKSKDGGGGGGGGDDDDIPGDVPLYGEWQTVEYHPPAAANGVVPKNERGNVDLIGGALPPPGTVHVSLPRITRVVRALRGIDFAAALVGFEYQRGGAVTPKFDGVVVCEEREEDVRDAWRAEEKKRLEGERFKELREAAKRWRLLLSAVWTRQSLREEFGMDDRGGGGGGGGERDEDEDDDDDDAAAATARRVAALTDDLDGHGGSRKKQKTWIPAFAEVEYV